VPQPCIWIIDDSEGEREHMRRALAPAFRIETFAEASSALEKLSGSDERPEVIVVDWLMPDVDGIEFCRFVRQRDPSRAIALLMVTAHPSSDDLSSALAVGADDFVRKPFDPTELIARVGSLARGRIGERARAATLTELARLQRLTAQLATSIRAQDVANAIFEHVAGELGTEGATVALREGDQLRVIRSAGYRTDLIERFTTMQISASLPLTDAVRENRPIWIESFEAMQRRYPELARVVILGRHSNRWAVLPLCGAGEPLGALAFSLAGAAEFSPEQRASFEQLAAITGAALDRARLFDEERAARERLAQTATFGEELVAIVSHDLRNPLTAASLSLLQASRVAEGTTAGAHIERVNRSLGRMRTMIEQLLDLTRVRLGSGIPIEPLPCDLATIVDEVTSEALSAHPGLAIEKKISGDAHGTWDPQRLAQLFTNVIANAAQHGDRSAPVRVSLASDAELARVTVTNQGAVIPNEALQHIFEPFRRASSARKEGLGLGLHIAREIASRHGGTIEITSAAGAGTTVTVTLPRRSGA
jgi:signal transduction histidine kinase